MTGLIDMNWPDEITPPFQNDVVQQTARQIKNDAVPVQVKRAGRLRPVGLCYWNVATIIEESGGQTVPGWMILWWPKLYGVAVHHAIWRHPDGRLIDVTEPQSPDKAARKSIFVPDDSIKITLDIPPRIDNRYFALRNDTDIQLYITVHKRIQAAIRQVGKIQWDAGYRCEEQFAIAAAKIPTPSNIICSVEAITRLEELRIEIDGAERETWTIIERLRRLKV